MTRDDEKVFDSTHTRKYHVAKIRNTKVRSVVYFTSLKFE